ncbi:hypothetical protein HP125_004470, partial [Salmonella enterica]|nr:hypothetical protein [Salmonella enterica]EGJ5143807.1 hypothetical protein [Salmonella enterica subsp. enterica]EGQ4733304.1 hypothetical protein [Salmonella enterica subsp. enterica]EID6731793.1 hypothetical protein [Salmonella enterica]EIW9904514.1 hypothetical protein [Salmonella enterica]
NATGNGNASIWTLTFDSITRDGDAVLLGGAKVSVLDKNGVVVPLGIPVEIQGNIRTL